MFYGTSKWCRENDKIHDVQFVCNYVNIGRSCNDTGAIDGLKFYLLPDFGKMAENGFKEAVFAAMGQSFFTLSVGIGALAIFGSYIGKERRLTGEAISITVLDTIVALVAGLIIFPSCFAFDVNPSGTRTCICDTAKCIP